MKEEAAAKVASRIMKPSYGRQCGDMILMRMLSICLVQPRLNYAMRMNYDGDEAHEQREHFGEVHDGRFSWLGISLSLKEVSRDSRSHIVKISRTHVTCWSFHFVMKWSLVQSLEHTGLWRDPFSSYGCHTTWDVIVWLFAYFLAKVEKTWIFCHFFLDSIHFSQVFQCSVRKKQSFLIFLVDFEHFLPRLSGAA